MENTKRYRLLNKIMDILEIFEPIRKYTIPVSLLQDILTNIQTQAQKIYKGSDEDTIQDDFNIIAYDILPILRYNVNSENEIELIFSIQETLFNTQIN